MALYTGKVKNGVIVPPEGLRLPEGSDVEFTLVSPAADAERLTDQLLSIARTTKNLPPDLAENHDHYLHGHPKR